MKWFYFREMTEADVDDEFMHCCDESSKDWQLVLDYLPVSRVFLEYLKLMDYDSKSLEDIRKCLLDEGYVEITPNMIPMC